jgi:DNA-binding beta-propeller fold protein YncE
VLAATVACCAGCTAGAAAPAPSGQAAAPGGQVAVPDRALAAPGCSGAVTATRTLGSAHRVMLGTGGPPFGVAGTPDGRFAFVVVSRGARSSVHVLRLDGTLRPSLVRSVAIQGNALGAAITPDGRYLLVADDRDGATVLDVDKAERGTAGAVLGTLRTPPSGPGGGAGNGPAGRGAIEVTTSPDGRFAFVTLERSQRAAVYNLAAAAADGFRDSGYVGAIPLGGAPVGVTVSPDGRWLYATSEAGPARSGTDAVGAPRPAAAASSPPARPQAPASAAATPGTLTVVDLRQAETDPAKSVVATVAAGCEPVRVVTSDDGALVWVTARASDDLLCFAASRLVSDPGRALVAITRVGEAPVGLAPVAGGSLIVVADSNRFLVAGRHADLSVVNVADALSQPATGGDGRDAAVLGRISSGLFPRDMTVAAGGALLLVANYKSGQLEAVSIASLAG